MSIVIPVLNTIKRVVGWMVAGLLGWMALLALAQLLSRWIFHSSINWADQHLRQLVLWVGLLGGVLAAAEARHLHMDFAQHLLKGFSHRVTIILIGAFAAGLSLYLAYLSADFINVEREAGVATRGILFGFTIPHWYLEMIFPLGFGLMAIFHLFAPLVPRPPSVTTSESPK